MPAACENQDIIGFNDSVNVDSIENFYNSSLYSTLPVKKDEAKLKKRRLIVDLDGNCYSD